MRKYGIDLNCKNYKDLELDALLIAWMLHMDLHQEIDEFNLTQRQKHFFLFITMDNQTF